MDEILFVSELTCPSCGACHVEAMPTNACTVRYPCPCGHMLRPKPGDCCAFCSYGSVPCLPIQVSRQTGGESCCS